MHTNGGVDLLVHRDVGRGYDVSFGTGRASGTDGFLMLRRNRNGRAAARPYLRTVGWTCWSTVMSDVVHISPIETLISQLNLYPFFVESGRPSRKTPAKGVHVSLSGPNWVFLTVCTKNRDPWLASISIMSSLHSIWHDRATTWLVSDYLLMPDHLHLFCAPHKLDVSIERWIAFWKDQLAKSDSDAGRFQTGEFHHRLRHGESYTEKWRYVKMNPVRSGLVDRPEDWPYQGRVHDIRW